jgi:hypothetical protein
MPQFFFVLAIFKHAVYCSNVAKKYVGLYPWYPMPTAVHITLMHGAEIIERAPLPIGQLYEDAQEARNKDIRRYRENFARKCTVAAVEISDRKDLNTLYKFRNLISVNRSFIKDYKVSVSI